MRRTNTVLPSIALIESFKQELKSLKSQNDFSFEQFKRKTMLPVKNIQNIDGLKIFELNIGFLFKNTREGVDPRTPKDLDDLPDYQYYLYPSCWDTRRVERYRCDAYRVTRPLVGVYVEKRETDACYGDSIFHDLERLQDRGIDIDFYTILEDENDVPQITFTKIGVEYKEIENHISKFLVYYGSIPVVRFNCDEMTTDLQNTILKYNVPQEVYPRSMKVDVAMGLMSFYLYDKEIDDRSIETFFSQYESWAHYRSASPTKNSSECRVCHFANISEERFDQEEKEHIFTVCSNCYDSIGKTPNH